MANVRDKKSARTRVLQAVNRYTEAAIADSWKGGGDPADIPAIEGELETARLRLSALLDELL